MIAAIAIASLKALSLAGPLAGLPVMDLLAAEAMLVSSFLLGRRLLIGPLKVRGQEVAGETAMAVALGMGGLSTMFFLAAMFGLMNKGVAWAVLIIPAALSMAKVRDVILTPSEKSDGRAVWSLGEYAMVGGILLFMVVTLQMALTPPISRDALIHHLAIPKIYLTRGGLVEVPFSIYSYYPMGFNMFYMGGMSVSSDITAKLLHFSVYGLSCLALFGVLSRHYSRPHSLLGPLLFSSIPVVVNVASWAYVDLALAFYTISSFLALDGWVRQRKDRAEPGGNGLLWAAALLTGFGMATKYNGLILFFIALLAVLYLAQFKGRGRAWCLASAVIFGLLALLAASPWLIRDLALTGNPIYPLFTDLLGGKEWQPERLKIPGLMVRRMLHQQSWLDDLLIPIRVSVSYAWNDFNTDGPLGPVFLLTLPLLLFFRGKPRIISVAGGMALVYYAFALLASGVRLRYLIPAFPYLILLSVHGLQGLTNRYRRWGRYAAAAAVMVTLGFNLYLILPLYSSASSISFLSGRLDRKAYLRMKIHDYDAYEYMNRYLPQNALVMFLYTGNDGYYLDRRYIYDSYYLGYTIKSLLRKAANGGQVAHELKKMGITHLFIDWYFLQLNFQSGVPPREVAIFQEFAREYLYPMYVTGDEVVYALKGIGD
jgi:hypothetical protein